MLPPALVADIGGGAYPAVINILLALQARARSGRGCHLDISMHDNLLPFAFAALAEGFATGGFPAPNTLLTHGGTPRYQIYRMADGRFLAAAPLEDRFWHVFCDAAGLPETAGTDEVAARIAAHDSAEWGRRFAGRDVCCSIVASPEEAAADPHFAARGLFAHRVGGAGHALPALPVPVDPQFRLAPDARDSPALGDAGRRADPPDGRGAAGRARQCSPGRRRFAHRHRLLPRRPRQAPDHPALFYRSRQCVARRRRPGGRRSGVAPRHRAATRPHRCI